MAIPEKILGFSWNFPKILGFCPVTPGKWEENPRIFLNLREASIFWIGRFSQIDDPKMTRILAQIRRSKPIWLKSWSFLVVEFSKSSILARFGKSTKNEPDLTPNRPQGVILGLIFGLILAKK